MKREAEASRAGDLEAIKERIKRMREGKRSSVVPANNNVVNARLNQFEVPYQIDSSVKGCFKEIILELTHQKPHGIVMREKTPSNCNGHQSNIGSIYVRNIIPNTAASDSALKLDDIILNIDGNNIDNIPIANSLLEGWNGPLVDEKSVAKRAGTLTKRYQHWQHQLLVYREQK